MKNKDNKALDTIRKLRLAEIELENSFELGNSEMKKLENIRKKCLNILWEYLEKNFSNQYIKLDKTWIYAENIYTDYENKTATIKGLGCFYDIEYGDIEVNTNLKLYFYIEDIEAIEVISKEEFNNKLIECCNKLKDKTNE
jgi:hypothetical protein